MMDHMLSIAKTLRAGLQNRLTNTISSDRVQGAVLEIDRFWLHSLHYYHRPYPIYKFEYNFEGIFAPTPWDYNFRPPNWDIHCKNQGYPKDSQPFRIRIILRHVSDDVELKVIDNYPTEYEGYPITYEMRPQLEAYSLTSVELIERIYQLAGFGSNVGSESAVSVGRGGASPTAGTLGGILKNPQSGKQFLVSCAHVFGSLNTPVYTPGPYENRGQNLLGVVRFSELPTLTPPNQPCNMRFDPDAPRLDLAVAELYPDTVPKSIFAVLPRVETIRVAASMTPYNPVSFTGKISGRTSAFLGGCTIWHSLKFADGMRCFGSIFEITCPEGRRGPLARKGDSGAWIMDNIGGLNCWCGMLIAAYEDNDRAYCCFAQDILEACQNKLPGESVLVP